VSQKSTPQSSRHNFKCRPIAILRFALRFALRVWRGKKIEVARFLWLMVFCQTKCILLLFYEYRADVYGVKIRK